MSAIEPPAAPKSNTGKIVGCVGCGCLTLVLGIAAAVVIGVFGIRKMATESDAFRDSIAAIAANPAATEALGSPVEPGFMGEVSINYDNGNQSINLSFPVSGPKGKGTLRVVGSKPAGAPKWEYSTWQLDIDGGESIPLGQ
jgi:hypothetical protein